MSELVKLRISAASLGVGVALLLSSIAVKDDWTLFWGFSVAAAAVNIFGIILTITVVARGSAK